MPASCISDFEAVGYHASSLNPWKVEVYITDIYSNAADATTYGSPELSVDFIHRFLDDLIAGGDLISEITQGFLFDKNALDTTKYHEWVAGVEGIPGDAASSAASLVKDRVCIECPRAKTVKVYVCICHRTWFNPLLLGREPFRTSGILLGDDYVPVRMPRVRPARTVSVEKSLDEVVIKRKRSNTMRQCVICMDKFKVGSKASQMPCSHVFHGDCILKWLHTQPVCPLCRFELPS